MGVRLKCHICGDWMPDGASSCPRHHNAGLTTPRGAKATPERAAKQYQPISEVTIPVVTPQFGKHPGQPAAPKKSPPAAKISSANLPPQRVQPPPPAAPPGRGQASTPPPPPRPAGPAAPGFDRLTHADRVTAPNQQQVAASGVHDAPTIMREAIELGAEPSLPAAKVAAVALPLGVADQRTMIHDPLMGETIGEFKVTQLIGVGGMGMVYKGVHPLIGKTVAIKVLRPEAADDREQVQRLLDEARALTAVRHRGIVDVFSYGTLPDGRPYLVMEYLQGRSLQARLEAEGRVPVTEALALFEDVLGGLGAAHKVGLVHRDMKPSNILLAKDAEGTAAKIVDFGIAKQGRPGSMTPQTVMYRCIGTPEFVSPEQACGQPVGSQSDLYSLGICAFFALTGKLPFEGETDTEILMKQVEFAPPDPASLEPCIPPAVSKLILRLLAKRPADRPASAEEVRAELAAIRKQLEAAMRSQPTSPAVKPVKKAEAARLDEDEQRELRSWHRFRATTALLLLIAIGCGVAWWFLRAS